jgi:WD40 repeat protein
MTLLGVRMVSKSSCQVQLFELQKIEILLLSDQTRHSHKLSLSRILFHVTGKILAAGCEDGQVVVWDESGTQKSTLTDPSCSLLVSAFPPTYSGVKHIHTQIFVLFGYLININSKLV